ncbi:hypothetical protein BGZ63DRAFT_351510 [Mariannaea sp. PMI_226]|nr:hypothetical protein BGZ63DRAFT_351510 [Mariannaea sp. PMI_226]
MRAPRIAILIFFLTAALFLTFRSLSPPPRSAAGSSSSSTYPAASKSYSSSKSKSHVQAESPKPAWNFMYYNTPFSLFPPNAAISLTDDNSTWFPARPAAFGPKLVLKGLSGQLWVGSGFTEDTLISGAELGCGDLPGWGRVAESTEVHKALREAIPQAAIPRFGGPNQAKKRRGTAAGKNLVGRPKSPVITNFKSVPAPGRHSSDDDIKGKIVLVMRGGCGFLDKVLWAQRRGAVGVIVGDNQKGGPLIQMFAHGPEVDNVTIPSVFTARTTAQILSSLTQPGSFIEESLDAQGNPVFRVQRGAKSNTRAQNKVQRKNKKDTTSQSSKQSSSFSKRSAVASEVNSRLTRFIRWVQPRTSVPINAGGLTKRMVKEARSPFDGAGNNEGASESMDETSITSKIIHEEDSDATYDSSSPPDSVNAEDLYLPDEPEGPVHEGLWVTITPTSNASPFFDTLLVLVISPLVTLTVVYAMLILRARIRRRRWRAPKSVVQQLPVRTYHTVAASPTDTPRTASPTSSSPTTPLLQDAPSHPRPRSKAPGGQESDAEATPSAAIPTPATTSQSAPRNEREKGSAGFSGEWRKYMGRQVECVVCLEEYIDGVSQVMSLPCGHEFHVDCITPWLTTRRRTCPICKGDVVRSLAHGPSSEPLYEPYRDDNDDDGPIAEGSGTARFGRDADLEPGFLPPEPRLPRGWTRPDNWMSAFSNNFGAPRSISPEDRTR